jgi:hypothetical protein
VNCELTPENFLLIWDQKNQPESRNPMELNATLAYRAAQDAGTRSMRAAGRPQWNESDWNAACAELQRIYPASSQQPPASHQQPE